MIWIDLVAMLAAAQFFLFSVLVGQARGRYGVKAPATTGDPVFERYYRVQMNTLELLVMFYPSLYVASRFMPVWLTAGLGVVFLIGRFIFLAAYVRDPSTRSLGYALSAGPVVGLIAIALFGLLRAAFITA